MWMSRNPCRLLVRASPPSRTIALKIANLELPTCGEEGATGHTATSASGLTFCANGRVGAAQWLRSCHRASRSARSIRTWTMNSTALASLAGVRPVAVLPARGIRAPRASDARGARTRLVVATISTRRTAACVPSTRRRRDAPSRPLAASGADGADVDDDVDALATRLESLKAKSRSMLEEASQLEAGIDASENDEVISESTRIKRSPSRSASGLPVGKMGVADAVAGMQPGGGSQQSQPPQPPTTNALLAGVVAVGGLAAAGAASAAGVAAGSEPVLAIVGAAAGFALLKTGQLIGSNLKEKAVPALGKQEAKAREKAAGGYVAPKQAAAATVIDEKKAAAKAASDSAMKSKSATASNDADAILAASSFVGASDLDKARLRRALRTIASTQKATSVSTSASAAASTSVPAGYVNNEQERKIYEMKRRSKELGTLNEFLDKYGPPDEVYGRAKAEKAVERQAAELIAPGNVTWKPRDTWLKVILWDCICYPLQVPFLFLAWLLGFSWGENPPPPKSA